jgi:hypothetical protein
MALVWRVRQQQHHNLADSKSIVVFADHSTGLSHAVHNYLPLFFSDTRFIFVDNHPSISPVHWLRAVTSFQGRWEPLPCPALVCA